METKIPSPSFTGLCGDDAGINISFPSGDIHAPEFRFRGLAIDGDGDALRLAVALGMNIDVGVNPIGFTATTVIAGYNSVVIAEYHEDNAMKATRRAITRAAAEIGVNMNALPDVN